MKTWHDLLDTDVYERLANCRTIKSDIVKLVQAKWRGHYINKAGFKKEDALVYVLELLDCNGFDADLTVDDYDDILSQII